MANFSLKRSITTVLNYAWRIWMILLGMVLTILFFVPVYLLSIKKEHYRYAYFFCRLWCKGMFYGMGFRYEVHNLTSDEIDEDVQYVFIANHTSIIDVMLPCLLLPNHPLCYVGKKELEKIPIFGTIYKRICVMVDRSSTKSRARVYQLCADRIEEGDSIVIFPEGGVPDDTSIVLDTFKNGAFTLSKNHQNPILIYTFVGLKEMFPFDWSKGHPGKIDVYFNKIMYPTRSRDELRESAYNEIKSTLETYSVP